MTALPVLSTVRNVAFATAGIVLAGFALLVLFGDQTVLPLTVWAVAAGVALFVVVFLVSLAAGRQGAQALWDEATHADFARSQGWTYNLMVLVVFPTLAVGIVNGLDPLRAFGTASLAMGALQMLLFSLFDLRGR